MRNFYWNFPIFVLFFTKLTLYNVKAELTKYDILEKVIDYDKDLFEYVDDNNTIIELTHRRAISMPIKLFNFKELKPTLEIVAFIKLDIKKSCLFSIKNYENEIFLELSFIPSGNESMRASVEIAGLTRTRVLFEHEKYEWTYIILQIDKDNLSLYKNCNLIIMEKLDMPLSDIEIPEDAYLIFGQSDFDSSLDDSIFEGQIKQVQIYSNSGSTDLYRLDACDGGLKLPDSIDHEGSDMNDASSKPENLEKFLKDDYSDDYGDDKGDSSDTNIPEKGEKGDRGEKGEKGDTIKGAIGPQGPPGPGGREGPRGEKGSEGSCTCSGDTISKYLSTMPKMRGPPGPPGPQGEDGSQGIQGLTGLTGKEGPRGLDGEPGRPGDIGLPGRDGEKGQKGESGRDGYLGPPGPPGPMGPSGPPGPVTKEIEEAKVPITGEKGEPGLIGPQGPPGPLGPYGPQGEKGDQGQKGDKGEQIIHKIYGLDGKPGPPGSTGEPGENGVPGQPGNHGRHGDTGLKGDKGDKGDLGPPGKSAKLSDILYEDMDDIEKEAVVEKLRGYKGDKGSQGQKGDMGDVGPIGPKGSEGNDGNHGPPGEKGSHGHKGELGPEGPKGQKGEVGEPGPPGNVPTSAISLMKGPKGDTGEIGKTGPRGPTGNAGKRGPTGPRGYKGAKGEIGDHGQKGATGSKGEEGVMGPKGERGETPFVDIAKLKGEKGDRGETGEPGEAGTPGAPGVCKEASTLTVTGPPGPPGPPGSPGVSIIGPKGEPGAIISKSTLFAYNDVNDSAGSNEDEFYSAETVIYKTSTALFKRTSATPLGTLAYILQEKILLLRVENGWQYVIMGSFLQTRDSHTSTTPKPIYHSTNPTENPSHAVTTPDSYIRLVALNEPYPGNMLTPSNRTGRNAAAQECYKQAQKLHLKSSFVPFLSNRIDDLRSIVQQERTRNIPVVNLHGTVLFDSWSSMFNGSGSPLLSSASIYSFNGKNVLTDPTWPNKAVWHGSNSFGIRERRAFCDEWSIDSPDRYGAASSLYSSRLLEQEQYSCDKKLIVLCVEATSKEHRRFRHLRPRYQRRYHDQNTETFDNRIPGL